MKFFFLKTSTNWFNEEFNHLVEKSSQFVNCRGRETCPKIRPVHSTIWLNFQPMVWIFHSTNYNLNTIETYISNQHERKLLYFWLHGSWICDVRLSIPFSWTYQHSFFERIFQSFLSLSYLCCARPKKGHGNKSSVLAWCVPALGAWLYSYTLYISHSRIFWQILENMYTSVEISPPHQKWNSQPESVFTYSPSVSHSQSVCLSWSSSSRVALGHRARLSVSVRKIQNLWNSEFVLCICRSSRKSLNPFNRV